MLVGSAECGLSQLKRERAVSLLRDLRAADPSSFESLRRLPAPDWGDIATQLSLLDLGPLFYRSVSRVAPPGCVPEPVRQNLQNQYFLHGARNLIVYEDLRELITSLQAIGVGVIALKGVCLAEAVYRDIALRPMCDIDILVRDTDLQKVTEELIRMGYGPTDRGPIAEQRLLHHHLPPFAKPGRPSVEVHHNIIPPSCHAAIPLDEIWERAREVTLAGVPTLVLSPEDLILHLCMHFSVHHRFSILHIKNLHDIAESVTCYGDEIDWQMLASRANRYRISKFVYSVLFLAVKMAGAEIPDRALRTFTHDARDEQIAETLLHYVLAESPLPLPDAFHMIGMTNSRATKAHILFRSIFPSPDFLRHKYHETLDSPARNARRYVRHLSEVLVRGSVLLAHLAVGTEKAKASLEIRRQALLVGDWLGRPMA